MKHVLLALVSLLLSARAGSAAAGCLTDTTQADFQAGVANHVDLAGSPGNVILASTGSATLDQQNTTITTSGERFTATQWTGQTFTPRLSGALSRIDLNIFCVFCASPPPSIVVSVRATAGGLPTGPDLAVSSLTVTDFSGSQLFYAANFASPATITAGTQYAIVMRPSAALTSGNLGFSNSANSSVSGNDVYAGGALVYSTNSGSTWAVQPYGTSPTSDGGFKTYVGGFSFNAAGDLTSSLKDSNPPAGTTPTWAGLSWTASLPSGTAVKFQAAGSNSTSGPFNFVGPDGTANTFFTTSGASLAQFNGSRYLKYHAFLSTASSSATPSISDTTTCYSSQTSSADLSIGVTDGATSATPGSPVTYTITASNAGPSPVTGATVTDTFPATLSACTWTCTGAGSGTCKASGSGNISDLVNLPMGATATYTATCTIAALATGTLVNSVSVTAPAGLSDPALGNNTASDSDTLNASADLSITNTDNVTTAAPGGQVIYKIKASNPGPSSVAGATVTDSFPTGLTCSWTCSGAGGGTCDASGSGNISRSVGLPGGADVTFTATCSIPAALTGTLSNTATVATPAGTSDPNPNNNSATDSDTLALQADVVVTMTDNVDSVQVGDVIDYVINITNPNGPSNVSVNVNDTLPALLSGGAWTCTATGGASCGNKTTGNTGTINATVTLPVGGKVSYALSGLVPADNGTEQFTNTVTTSLVAGTDPAPGNNSVSDTDILVVFISGFE